MKHEPRSVGAASIATICSYANAALPDHSTAPRFPGMLSRGCQQTQHHCASGSDSPQPGIRPQASAADMLGAHPTPADTDRPCRCSRAEDSTAPHRAHSETRCEARVRGGPPHTAGRCMQGVAPLNRRRRRYDLMPTRHADKRVRDGVSRETSTFGDEHCFSGSLLSHSIRCCRPS